jgi:hypothetical protein
MNIKEALAPLAIAAAFAAVASPVRAEAFKQLEEYAQRVTLPIVTPANGGSITVIGRSGSTYTFLTAAHVIAGTAKSETNTIDLSSQAGKETFVEATIRKDFRPDGIDLAVGTFQYSGKADLEVLPLFGMAPDAKWDEDPSQYQKISLPCDHESIGARYRCHKMSPMYGETDCYYLNHGKAPCNKPPVMTITRRLSTGTYDRFEGVYNNKRYELKTATIGDFVVAGYSLPSRSITERFLRMSFAVPQNLLSRNKDGYNLIYETTSTVPGMSGGPVVAARLCPGSDLSGGTCMGSCGSGAYAGIIGIHGKSEEYSNTGSRSGISLAIPINSPAVTQYLVANAQSLGIPVEKQYVQLVKQSCSSGKNFF